MHDIIISKPLPAIMEANNKITLLEKNTDIEKLRLKLEINKEKTKQINALSQQYEIKYKLLKLGMQFNKKYTPTSNVL